MAKRKEQTEYLDEMSRQVLQAASASDREAEGAISSPFLYAKIRARIAEENQKENRALSILFIFKRAIPALVFIALMTTLAFWLAPKNATPNISQPNYILPYTDEPQLQIVSNPSDAPLTACSIASKEECAVSTKDVVAILMNTSEGQK